MQHRRKVWRKCLVLAGLVLPAATTWAVNALDETESLLFYPLFALYGVLTMPGWIIPLKGVWTLVFITACWVVLAVWVGGRLDDRREPGK